MADNIDNNVHNGENHGPRREPIHQIGTLGNLVRCYPDGPPGGMARPNGQTGRVGLQPYVNVFLLNEQRPRTQNCHFLDFRPTDIQFRALDVFVSDNDPGRRLVIRNQERLLHDPMGVYRTCLILTVRRFLTIDRVQDCLLVFACENVAERFNDYDVDHLLPTPIVSREQRRLGNVNHVTFNAMKREVIYIPNRLSSENQIDIPEEQQMLVFVECYEQAHPSQIHRAVDRDLQVVLIERNLSDSDTYVDIAGEGKRAELLVRTNAQMISYSRPRSKIAWNRKGPQQLYFGNTVDIGNVKYSWIRCPINDDYSAFYLQKVVNESVEQKGDKWTLCLKKVFTDVLFCPERLGHYVGSDRTFVASDILAKAANTQLGYEFDKSSMCGILRSLRTTLKGRASSKLLGLGMVVVEFLIRENCLYRSHMGWYENYMLSYMSLVSDHTKGGWWNYIVHFLNYFGFTSRYAIALYLTCVVLFFVRLYSTSIFGLFSSIFLVRPVYSYSGLIGYSYSGDLIGLALFSILLYWLIYRKLSKVNSWNKFKRVYKNERRTISYTGKCPTPWFKGIESELDLSAYPIDQSGRINCCDPEHTAKSSKAFRIVAPVFSNVFPSTFTTSVNNLYRAIVTRVLCEVPKADSSYFESNAKFTPPIPVFYDHRNRELVGLRYLTTDCLSNDVLRAPFSSKSFRVSHLEWNARFPKQRRDANIRAMYKIKHGYYSARGNTYGAFVKRELAMDVTRDDYVDTRPRVIQACSSQMKNLMGPHVLSICLAFKYAWWYRSPIFYAGSRTAEDLNTWIEYAHSVIDDPVYLSTDFSKYDVTQNGDAIEQEIAWMEMLGCSREIKHWRDIANAKRLTRGYSVSGGTGRKPDISYVIPYKRKSGECETSIGNSFLTAQVISTFFVRSGIRFMIALLGDDNFAVIERGDIIKAYNTDDVQEAMATLKERFVEHCTKLGFEVKITLVLGANNITVCDFLSLRFYPTRSGLKVGKKPGRNLAKIGFLKNIVGAEDSEYLPIFLATLNSMRPTSMHVPFLRKYITIVGAHLIKLGVKPTVSVQTWYHLSGEEYEADSETFVAFEQVYGLNKHDEDEFAIKLQNHLDQFGHQSCMDSALVESLWRTDLGLGAWSGSTLQ